MKIVLHKDNVYSFDECSILHSCSVRIPASDQWKFGKTELKHRNCEKVNTLFAALKQQGMTKYRFIPSLNLEMNLLKTANDLIDATGVQPAFLPKTFRVEIMDQLREFHESLSDWREIPKAKAFQHIKDFFKKNERPLKKSKNPPYTNIPGDDDCQILAGLISFSCHGTKFLVSEDEDFWGYADVILTKFGINIVKEWECHTLV